MIITRHRRDDAAQLAQLMYRTIRTGATHYTIAERRAWAPKLADPKRFAKRLAKQRVWVARSYQGPVGFMSVDSSGYIDLAYIAPEAQGHGLFGRILACIETHSPDRLSTHASLHAQGAFAHYGFAIAHHEVVVRLGERLNRAFMQRG